MSKHVIERSRYFLVPRTSGRRQLALARLLIKRKPAQSSPNLDAAAEDLGGMIKTITQAYVVRHLEANLSSPAEEADLDNFVDGLWIVLRERIDHWGVFGRPAAQRLAAKQSDGFDYAIRVKQADRAAQVREQLLGAAGLDFTRLNYAEQSEHMITLWEVIAQKELEDIIVKLIGADFYGALQESQADYAEMVEARAAREKGSSVNLRELTLDLQQTIQTYLIALLGMIRDNDPENVAMMRAALRPMDALKTQLERERSRNQRSAAEPEAGEAPEAEEIAELLAEEQALDEIFGPEANPEDNPEPPVEDEL